MDLSNYDLNVDMSMEKDVLAPGRYNVSYVSAEEITGKNGWVAIKMVFAVEGKSAFVPCTFTVASNNPKAVDVGKQSLAMLANAAGLSQLKNTEDLKGKTVAVEVKHNERGYAEIDDNYGKNWQAVAKKVSDTKAEPKQADEEDTSDIPF
tara:strand:- start:117 stop:566 length:450 start_codon:yes stop_codon:yes gene_type:complete